MQTIIFWKMLKLSFITTIALMIAVSLLSGLLFSFSIAVSPGLKYLSDIEFLKAMQSINKEILNALFFLCFFSPLLLFPLTIFFQQHSTSNRWLLILGFIAYFMVLLITATINVPLNNQLEKFDLLHANQLELSKMREIFENRWTFWNNIRTVLAVASLVFLVLSRVESSKLV